LREKEAASLTFKKTNGRHELRETKRREPSNRRQKEGKGVYAQVRWGEEIYDLSRIGRKIEIQGLRKKTVELPSGKKRKKGTAVRREQEGGRPHRDIRKMKGGGERRGDKI